jgi:hypothetical protein
LRPSGSNCSRRAGLRYRREALALRSPGAAVLAATFLAEGLWVYLHELTGSTEQTCRRR